jgi:hypothetical protein
LPRKEWFWDIHVAGNNNYITRDGVIHHNSGKTHSAVCRAIIKKLQYPKQNVAYYLPTFDLVRTIGFPRFSEMLDLIGIKHKLNRTDATVLFGRDGEFGQIIFRTMDTPERIIGYEVADSLVDELDTLPTDKAREVWQKIVARNRQKKPDGSENTAAVATSPEGFRFVYDTWVKNPKPGYQVIKAKTESNIAHLQPGYIDTLKAIYPTALLQAYLDGEFVNLAAGSVYFEFNRNLNGSDQTIQPNEPLHIGMDFNVGKMAAVVYVLRNTDPHAVGELTGLLDTPAMISAIKLQFPNHPILVYPDATGQARKANNASVSDLSLLRAAKFQVLVAPDNPAVKDRILAMNSMIHVNGRRRLKVNSDKCPLFAEALERQAYNEKGEPDKQSGLDHILDAGGYMIAYRYPIKSRGMMRIALGGI